MEHGILAAILIFMDAGLPPLGWTMLLPDRDEIYQNIHVNCGYRNYLRDFVEVVGPTPQVLVEIKTTKAIYDLYDDMRDAANLSYKPTNRRMLMLRIVETIGKDRLFRGDFPPPLPAWRYGQ